MKQYKKPCVCSMKGGYAAVPAAVLAALPTVVGAASAVGVAAVGATTAAKAVKQYGDFRNVISSDSLDPVVLI